MRRHDPQNQAIDHQVDIERATGFIPGDFEIDRARCQRGEAGQNGVGKSAAPGWGGPHNDFALCGTGKECRLVSARTAGATGVDFLKTHNVCVDFT
jgi:hypothetical protein